MGRDEVELLRRRLVGAGEGEHAERDQVLLIVLPDGGDHTLGPLPEDVVP